MIGGHFWARHIDLRVHREHQAVQECDIYLYKAAAGGRPDQGAP